MERREVFGNLRPVCVECEVVHWSVMASAACAAVVHRQKLLLVERGIQPYLGCWGFPGGFQDYGEPLEQTAVRETLEETGLPIRVERVLHVDLTRDDPRKVVNVAIFLARPDLPEEDVDGRLSAADDARRLRWFGFGEFPDAIAFDVNRAVLAELSRRYPDGDIL